MDQSERRFPCTVCGSSLRFGPGRQRLVCGHCGSDQRIPGTPAGRMGAQRGLPIARFAGEPAQTVQPPETGATVCPNCAAQVEFDGQRYSTECPYCGTPVVHAATAGLPVNPKAILPFAVSESEAYRSALEKLTDTTFVPEHIANDVRLRPNLKGVFLPFWVFGADSQTVYTVNASKSWFERVGKGEYAEEVLRTEWTRIDDQLSLHLDDFLVRASANPPKPFDVALEPWDLSALVPFEQDYLAGFQADRSTVAAAEAYGEAQQKMHGIIRSKVQKALGADDVIFANIKTRFSHETFKLVLLPFWMVDYRIGGKTYLVFVNGQTGKAMAQVSAFHPRVGWSGWRILALAGLIIAAMFLAVLFTDTIARLFRLV